MNILKRDRELKGKILTYDQLLDWRNRLSYLKSLRNKNDEEYYWLEQQIKYCDDELITLTCINAE